MGDAALNDGVSRECLSQKYQITVDPPSTAFSKASFDLSTAVRLLQR